MRLDRSLVEAGLRNLEHAVEDTLRRAGAQLARYSILPLALPPGDKLPETMKISATPTDTPSIGVDFSSDEIADCSHGGLSRAVRRKLQLYVERYRAHRAKARP